MKGYSNMPESNPLTPEMEKAYTGIVVRNFPQTTRAYWRLQIQNANPDFRSILDGSKN